MAVGAEFEGGVQGRGLMAGGVGVGDRAHHQIDLAQREGGGGQEGGPARAAHDAA